MIQDGETRVLVVDDEPAVCELLTRWLTAEGCSCAAAVSGEDALLLLGSDDFDLVLIDIMMPGMSGIDLLRQIKTLFPNVAILMVTAVDDRKTAIMTLRLGAYGYVVKPFDRTEIVINVVNALERRRLTLLSQEHERGLLDQVRLHEKYHKLVQYFPDGIAEFVPAQPIQCDRAVAELLPMIWDAKLTDANLAFANSYGYDRVEDSIGVSLATLFPPARDCEDLYRKWIQSRFQTSCLETTENTRTLEPRYFENTLLGDVQTGRLETFWAIRRDISERKLTEETIRGQGEFLNTVLASLAHPFYVINVHDYAIEKANPVARSFGITETSTCYSATHNRTSPCDGTGRPCPVKEIKKTKQPLVVERVYDGPDGKPRHFEIHAYPILDDRGSVSQIIESCMDVSDRKAAQDLLIQAETFKAVADLTSGVAHNFNNLLQVILGNAQLALMNLKAGECSVTKSSLAQIIENCRVGTETVRRLGRFGKDSAAIEGTESDIVDLSDIVRRACDVTSAWVKSHAKKNGIHIDLKSNLKEGCFVKVRESELFEVLVNLVKNAVEAMPDGGDVRIVTTVQEDKVVLTVQDTGLGIPQNVVNRLFTPFFTTKCDIGTGLGLATSRSIVDRHGGRIFVESIEGDGATFTVLLPFAKEFPTHQEVGVEPVVAARMTVLAIDDMEPVISVLQEGLAYFGHTVLTALSGLTGLEIFKQNLVDLVICDLRMPGMSGWKVGKAIRDFCAKKGVPKPPFIILTGWGDQANQAEKVRESGVDAIVQKPVDLERLLAVMKDVAEKKCPATGSDQQGG